MAMKTTADPPRAAETDAPPDLDYAAIAASPEFKALHESRRRFAVGGTLVATAAVLGVFALYGFAPDAMGKPAIGSVTWALVMGFFLVALSFVMAMAFSRASRKWDEMVEELVAEHEGGGRERTGRFSR